MILKLVCISRNKTFVSPDDIVGFNYYIKLAFDQYFKITVPTGNSDIISLHISRVKSKNLIRFKPFILPKLLNYKKAVEFYLNTPSRVIGEKEFHSMSLYLINNHLCWVFTTNIIKSDETKKGSVYSFTFEVEHYENYQESIFSKVY